VLVPHHARFPRPESRVQSSSLEELRRERVAIDLQVLCGVGDDAGERTKAQRTVVRDGDVMLAVLLRREPHVAARFARYGVRIAAERPRQIAA
jgi:hypothetical protein